MKRVYLLSIALAALIGSVAIAQFAGQSPTWKATDVKGHAGRILSVVYGSQLVGCTKTAVTTTGHNRSGPYLAGRMYTIYGYDNTTLAGEILRCVQGSSSVDVTALAGSKFGKIIYANQQEIWTFPDSTNVYLSCISANATKQYDVCEISY